jgi:hypothetical protein
MPLGDLWLGLCMADTATPFRPDDHTLSELCNMGYARGRCPRFPQAPGADAVRFCISRDSGDLVQVMYAIEQNHHPHAHGTVEYARSAGTFGAGELDANLESQARAYVSSYLRRKPAAA